MFENALAGKCPARRNSGIQSAFALGASVDNLLSLRERRLVDQPGPIVDSQGFVFRY
jgi:hypothetical protein